MVSSLSILGVRDGIWAPLMSLAKATQKVGSREGTDGVAVTPGTGLLLF